MSEQDIILERRVRSAELALSSTRKLYLESEQEIGQLRGQIKELRSELEAAIGDRDAARAEYERRTAEQETEVRAAARAAAAERIRREELEHALGRAERRREEQDELARTLKAEKRADELEAEVEILSRHAAEFEHGVSVALSDAFKLLSVLGGRVKGVLDSLGSDARPAGSATPQPTAPADPAPAAPEPLRLDSLDAALERLRAQAPPPEGGGQHSS